jgi:hypothetical protein
MWCLHENHTPGSGNPMCFKLGVHRVLALKCVQIKTVNLFEFKYTLVYNSVSHTQRVQSQTCK